MCFCCEQLCLFAELSKDSLINRVFKLSQGDLKDKSEEDYFRQFKLRYCHPCGWLVLTACMGGDVVWKKLKASPP